MQRDNVYAHPTANQPERQRSEYLTTAEVSAWIRVSSATLCRWRQSGHGPRVTWMGPNSPRYRRDDVEAWLKRAAA